MDEDDGDVDILCIRMAELEVADQARKEKKMAMPDPRLVVEMEKIALQILGHSDIGSHILLMRMIIAFLGAPPLVIAKCWELTNEENVGSFPQGMKKKHLLWTFNFLKECISLEADCHGCNVRTRKTFETWVWYFTIA